MTIQEFRNHPEYALCMNKIRNYRKGFRFTVPYWKMSNGQKNGMKIVLNDAVKEGLIQSVAFGLSLELENTDETFERI